MSAPNPSTPEATKPSTKLMRDVTLDGVVVITEADDPHRNWFGEVSDAEEYWSLDERFAHADLIVRAVNSYDDMLAVLKAIAIAQKEPAGGEYWTARELANKWGIFTDDLAGERVLLKLAEYAISKAERGQ